MRKRFEPQPEIGQTPIECIKIPTRSRDEIPAVLRALQHIYKTPELNEKVFKILEKKIGEKKTGRPGMNYWEILVLGVVRLALDANYDKLEHVANYDSLVRSMLGISNTNFFGEGKQYPYQTIRDNVSLLDEKTIDKINELVVKAGHSFKKKDELSVKMDSYVLESNVHFPTDINLLWDAARKCMSIIKNIQKESKTVINGWRKLDYWNKRTKNAYIVVSRIHSRGGKNKEFRLYESAGNYLDIAEIILEKINSTKPQILEISSSSLYGKIAYINLLYFIEMLDKHIDLLKRRVIKGEKIPQSEKIFSLFEPYTEWINKGKSGNRVELGLKIAIATDQYGFILNHKVMEKEQDAKITVPFSSKLLKSWEINSISFDKGFWSKDNFEKLKDKVENLVMPKKGKRNKEEKQRESSNNFKSLKNRHAAIESDINSLEHHGLNRCPDRGIKSFKKYTSLGILSFNLHRLGNMLIAEDRKQEQKKQKKKAA